MEEYRGKFIATSYKVLQTDIIFSSHGAPGGGGHAPYMFSSTPGEQAMA